MVVIEDTVWRYGMAFHRLHGSPAGAIAVYDPRLGAVVVASHRPEWHEGQVIDVTPPVTVALEEPGSVTEEPRAAIANRVTRNDPRRPRIVGILH